MNNNENDVFILDISNNEKNVSELNIHGGNIHANIHANIISSDDITIHVDDVVNTSIEFKITY